jgi:sigma-B regulation protein RsbU (phosphoserine phosphatase)
MPGAARVLLYHTAPGAAGELGAVLRRRGLEPVPVAVNGTGAGATAALNEGDVAVVLVEPAALERWQATLPTLFKELAAANVASVVRGVGDDLPCGDGQWVEWLSPDVTLEELAGRVSELARYAPLVGRMQRELDHLYHLGGQINRYFTDIDQEMRLASRLQRDLLPREFPDVPPLRFAVLYRAASWVSGDLYDVFRIDEQHVGLFVSDAMGHGVAAGLLTMFLRQALVPKRTSGQAYTIVPPARVLDALHACLVRQELPHSQFITGVYGVVNTARREIRLARAGHPYPIHIAADGAIREIRTRGSLLGLPDVVAEFEEATLALATGDKLVFYTDGLEQTVLTPAAQGSGAVVFTDQFRTWARLSAAELIEALGDHLDHEHGSLHPVDDMTVLVLEVL